MLKRIIIIFFLSLALSNCSTFSEINEKAKGDGIPYIPGI